MPVVFLCGFKGSGKDLVGEYFKKFAKEERIKFHSYAFAERIKKCLMETFHLKTECDYDLFKRSEITVKSDLITKHLNGRDILRSIGMSMRSCNEDYFLNYTKEKVEKHLNDFNLITDLRFQNELDWANENGFPIVKVIRDGSESDGHVSENGIDSKYCTYFIENNGTEEELKQKARQIFFKILEKEKNGKEPKE